MRFTSSGQAYAGDLARQKAGSARLSARSRAPRRRYRAGRQALEQEEESSRGCCLHGSCRAGTRREADGSGVSAMPSVLNFVIGAARPDRTRLTACPSPSSTACRGALRGRSSESGSARARIAELVCSVCAPEELPLCLIVSYAGAGAEMSAVAFGSLEALSTNVRQGALGKAELYVRAGRQASTRRWGLACALCAR